MFDKVLIANRGAIAVRIAATLRKMGVPSVGIYTDADGGSLHVDAVDEAIALGDDPRAYVNGELILEVARRAGASAVHPGYGFLSENAAFATACEEADIAFIGPTPEQIRSFGLKHVARELAVEADVPLVPGSDVLSGVEEAIRECERIGYPAMLKSSAGGGGIGMRRCRNADELREGYAAVERLSDSYFGDARLFVERCVDRARHIEVQIFGDGHGRVVTLGERDCSMQRRNQKVLEETPAPLLTDAEREAIFAAARRLGASVAYRSAGTIEFIYDVDAKRFYFLEVNTRLQVEHGVTELVTGLDLVEWMVRLAAGEAVPLDLADRPRQGAAVEARIYAENPRRDFQPSAGTLLEWRPPAGVRCDTWVEKGSGISVHYDPMLAKVIAHGADRPQAIAGLRRALRSMRVVGVETNVDFLSEVLLLDAFRDGTHTTKTLEGFAFAGQGIEVVEPGLESSIQDWPGRLGYWDIGVPPSGPMDDLAFRMGNRMLGNDEGAAGLEMTLQGPTLRFHQRCRVVLTGADMAATVGERAVEPWAPAIIDAGEVLTVGAVRGAGCRGYLLVEGGFDVPDYLGSGATFMLGGFGGNAGRRLQVGDSLRIAAVPEGSRQAVASVCADPPTYGAHWDIGVLYGPHGAPDYFLEEDIEAFFAADWKVHYNSNRTGIRLVGPKPRWARPDGGEAGLHPSNIHDNEYAVGTVDFTGDMPIILCKDGPSLGGFVCPATVAESELWKLGQLKAGDSLRFVPWTHEEARVAKAGRDAQVAGAAATTTAIQRERPKEGAVLVRVEPPEHPVGITIRRAGDRYVLLEYGENVLDLALRFRVHALMDRMKAEPHDGVLEIAPGIRSLQVRYDASRLPLDRLLKLLLDTDAALPDIAEIEVPTRVLHLPLSWDDPATRLAIDRYMRSVRQDAPWCPSNIEFIRRINGLAYEEEVRRIVFDATYLVLGLGDVYLGAPVATPLDPRHRLVTTKYNPARTWTPENAVGIGGAYLCIYGMEGPGGYQFVGRTIQVWNAHRSTDEFEPGKPWLLRFFDQIRFYPVEADELLHQRDAFLRGRFQPTIEEEVFRYADYQRFLEENADSIAAFRRQQRQAFGEERERWQAAGQDLVADEPPVAGAAAEIPAGATPVPSPISGVVWKVVAEEGSTVEAGDVVCVLEAMKAETEVCAPLSGKVVAVAATAGDVVEPGQALLGIEPAEN